ncbi:PTS glucitol/sorbitol transporter subunit IIC [Pseudoclavibacter helvolus]|uniref:PTS glucitol/sorbitol transporter subunit IIC n=1 Tax=Pseudoclavibacter helvolus TaxID=255205 RepID=UPI000AFD52AF|nr:PTS glucitol/sorbitol transporter subunit IIC [Pseudoclavibacter helvolus]
MEVITWIAENFIGLFNASAESLMGLITGILPLLLVLLTAMYAVTTWIGEERVTRAVRWAGKYAITRYTVMPIIAVIMLTNPMAYTFGRFLPRTLQAGLLRLRGVVCAPGHGVPSARQRW